MKRIISILCLFLTFSTVVYSAVVIIPEELTQILENLENPINICTKYPDRMCISVPDINPEVNYVALELQFKNCQYCAYCYPDKSNPYSTPKEPAFGLILKYQKDKLMNYWLVSYFPRTKFWEKNWNSYKSSDFYYQKDPPKCGKLIVAQKTPEMEKEAKEIIELAIKAEKIIKNLNIQKILAKELLKKVESIQKEIMEFKINQKDRNKLQKHFNLVKKQVNLILQSSSQETIKIACNELHKLYRNFSLLIFKCYMDYFDAQCLVDFWEGINPIIAEIEENKLFCTDWDTSKRVKIDFNSWKPYSFRWDKNKKITNIFLYPGQSIVTNMYELSNGVIGLKGIFLNIYIKNNVITSFEEYSHSLEDFYTLPPD